MNKTIAIELNEYANKVCDRYSNKNREGNYHNESFNIEEIIPTSDPTAYLIFSPNSGKLAAFLFYYIPRGISKGWKYLVPTDSHITGFRAF